MAETYDLMIPEAGNLPAHIVNSEMARQANEDAGAGISDGFAPRIKMNGKQFVLVDGKEEVAIMPGEMVTGSDKNLYLRIAVLGTKKALQKAWYASKYNPNEEGQAPDCFSNDGERPDSRIINPQCEVCANCPQNAFGSGTDQNGNATDGKACGDRKIIATFVPKKGIHKLAVTPTSLGNWKRYLKKLSAVNIPVTNVFTLVGFDPDASYPVMVYEYGGPIPEASVEKLVALAESPEAQDIINEMISPSTKSAAPKEPAGETPAAKKKRIAAEKKAVKAAEKKAADEAAASGGDDDLGLDDTGLGEADAGANVSDDDIKDALDEELGL